MWACVCLCTCVEGIGKVGNAERQKAKVMLAEGGLEKDRERERERNGDKVSAMFEGLGRLAELRRGRVDTLIASGDRGGFGLAVGNSNCVMQGSGRASWLVLVWRGSRVAVAALGRRLQMRPNVQGGFWSNWTVFEKECPVFSLLRMILWMPLFFLVWWARGLFARGIFEQNGGSAAVIGEGRLARVRKLLCILPKKKR